MFDLKGSKLNRKRGPMARRGHVLLDEDLASNYELPEDTLSGLVGQLNRDVGFLRL